MKNIVLAGCSHSSGVGLGTGELSWGEVLAKNFNYKLTNFAVPGTSVQFSTQNLINYALENTPDVVILQLTTLDRYPIPRDGEPKFLSGDIKAGDGTPEVYHLLPMNYLEAIDGKNKVFPVEVIKHFYEKVTFSTFYINTLINELMLLQNLIESKGGKFIVVPYDDYFWGRESGINIWNSPKSSKLKLNNYIDYPFMKWLRDNYNEKDYYIDNGFHLSKEGHRIFAEEYFSKYIQL